MTGSSARTHGDRIFDERLPMPDGVSTLAGTFRSAGYQAYAVGKMHVYPQRARVGFDEVLLNEEGRHWFFDGSEPAVLTADDTPPIQADDYEHYLIEQGLAGQQYTHAMANNDYYTRPWHLEERHHPTNWTTREMCRTIARRDPTRPALWYCSYNFPHPPLAATQEYLDMYQCDQIDMPFCGQWAEHTHHMPYALASRRQRWDRFSEHQIRLARRAFYALCTHIDQQIRLLIGTLREQGILDNTIIAFVSDHGDMLGNHHLWGKPVFFEESAKVPIVIMGTRNCPKVGTHRRDDRLATLADVMPTLLGLCNIPVPESVEGKDLLSDDRRDHIYGEHFENDHAIRMIRDTRYKLIYYPVGNRVQLFDMLDDPDECTDLSEQPHAADVRRRLTKLLVKAIYGSDRQYMRNGELVGLPDKQLSPMTDRAMMGQRGWRFYY